jgi:hypothetical protein
LQNLLILNDTILKLQNLLDSGCEIVKIYPMVFGSDAEISIVTVEVSCPDKNIHKLRAFRDEAIELREFIRIKNLDTKQNTSR